jgi:hypothetical protein
MGIGARRPRASIAVLTVLLSGCGLLETDRLQVTIRNNTEAPALVQMVRFDFPTGTFGAALGDAVTIPAGERATLQVPIPTAKDWALRINDLPGVTSLGWTEAEDAVTGEGPLTYSITVDVDGLSTSVSRAGDGAGETSAPAPD